MSNTSLSQQNMDNLQAAMMATKDRISKLHQKLKEEEDEYASQCDALNRAIEQFMQQEYGIDREGNTNLYATDEFIKWLETRENDPFDPHDSQTYKGQYFTVMDYYDMTLFDIDTVFDETIREVPLNIVLGMKIACDERNKSNG